MNDETTENRPQDDELSSLLKNLPMVAAEPGFFDRALVRAAETSRRRQQRRWLATGFGGAVAAGLVAWLIGGVLFTSPDIAVPDIPGITIALEERREVSFVFASSTALDNAVLTIELPEGVELEGFPGQAAVSWETSLDAGKNHLPLTLVATRAVDGVVVARLEHDARSKTFRLRVSAG
jgi:hypothetical protein